MSVSIVEGNLLNSNAQYIIHQTNCVSFGFSGLANSIFEKYPESNICGYFNKTPNASVWR